MRENKFRAITESGNTWVYGQYASRKDSSEHYIIQDLSHVDGWEWNAEADFIRAETVGQYTGIDDTNGKEIYGGDIVKRKSLALGGIDITGIVKMLEGCWVIDDGHDAVKLWTECDENEVIGNIHENPELLEK